MNSTPEMPNPLQAGFRYQTAISIAGESSQHRGSPSQHRGSALPYNGAMHTFEAQTLDGTLVTLGKDRANGLYVDGQRVGTITNTPFGVILMCDARGYTIAHPDYFRLLALTAERP